MTARKTPGAARKQGTVQRRVRATRQPKKDNRNKIQSGRARTAARGPISSEPSPHSDDDGLQLMLRIEIPIDNLANIGSDEEFVYAEANQLDRTLIGSLDELVEYLYAVAEEGNFLPPYRSSMFARRVGQA
jgi:hypothetical protein